MRTFDKVSFKSKEEADRFMIEKWGDWSTMDIVNGEYCFNVFTKEYLEREKLKSSFVPSLHKQDPWLAVIHEDYKFGGKKWVPHSKSPRGKWMVFLTKGVELDNAWSLVKKAVLDGELGHAAKCSTAYEKATHSYDTKGVLIVYTPDASNETECMQIGRTLKKLLNLDHTIYYKTDAATQEGRYASKNDRVSTYSL